MNEARREGESETEEEEKKNDDNEKWENMKSENSEISTRVTANIATMRAWTEVSPSRIFTLALA